MIPPKTHYTLEELYPVSPPPGGKQKTARVSGGITKWLYITFLTLVILFSILVVAAGMFQDRIGKLVIGEINKQLKTKLTVQRFNLSLLSGFPDASAELNGAVLKDAFGANLLQAKKLSLRFGLGSLFGSTIKIHSFVLTDAVVSAKVDAKGRASYDIMKPSPPSTGQPLRFSVESAQLTRVRVIYQDAQAGQGADFNIQSASASGDFSASQFAVNSKAQTVCNFISRNGQKYLTGKPVAYNARVNVDLQKGNYALDDVQLSLANNPFSIQGTIQQSKLTGSQFNLTIQNKEGAVEQLFQLLPAQYAASLVNVKTTGAYHFKTMIRGRAGATESPLVQGAMDFSNGTLSSPSLKGALTGVGFHAAWDSKVSTLDFSNCNANWGGEKLDLQLHVRQFSDPIIDLGFNGAIPMQAAYGLASAYGATAGSGAIRLQGLKVQGRYRDMTSLSGIARVAASGAAEFQNAAVTLKGEPTTLTGKLTLNNNQLILDAVRFTGAGTDATVTGDFSNLIPVLFAVTEKEKGTFLTFLAGFKAKQLDVARLVGLFRPGMQAAPTAAAGPDSLLAARDAQPHGGLLNWLKGTFVSDVDQFTYGKITGRNFKGDVRFPGTDQMTLKGSAYAMGGNFTVDGVVDLQKRMKLATKLIADQVNITEFFRQCNDFDQKFLTSNNLSGSLQSKMAITAFWDEQGNFQPDKFYLAADMTISDGQLIGMKMLENFSTYVHAADLRRVRFATLQNYLQIAHSTLTIPTMLIRSNALNLQLSGTHTFDQKIDYNMVVNAGQVLMNRFRLSPNYDPQPAQNGWFNLFYNITGTVSNFQYRSDKSKVKGALAQGEILKKEIQQQLGMAFGAGVLPDPAVAPTLIPTAGTAVSPLKPPVKPGAEKKKNEDEIIPGF